MVLIQRDSPCATILDSNEEFTKLYLFGDLPLKFIILFSQSIMSYHYRHYNHFS